MPSNFHASKKKFFLVWKFSTLKIFTLRKTQRLGCLTEWTMKFFMVLLQMSKLVAVFEESENFQTKKSFFCFRENLREWSWGTRECFLKFSRKNLDRTGKTNFMVLRWIGTDIRTQKRIPFYTLYRGVVLLEKWFFRNHLVADCEAASCRFESSRGGLAGWRSSN